MAFGIYGFGMYLIEHPVRGAGHLAADTLCCRGRTCCCAGSKTVHGDTVGGCNEIAFLREAGLEPDDIVYANFGTGLRKRPYCVVADKEWKAIVVVIRGTFALEDLVADLTIKPTQLDDIGERFGFDGQGEHAHSGMLASAEWIYSDLEEQRVLEKLLREECSQYPGFSLYVTGHSLGAGVAALLALMLHQKYDLKCICYEPPGCVMTKKAASQKYIHSYVMGSDIVPRLSVLAIEHLRDTVLTMIARTKVPKYQVLSPWLSCSKPKKDTVEESDSMLHRNESVPESSFYSQVLDFWRYQDEIKEERGERTILLLPPGKRIVHLIKTDENMNFGGLFAFSSTSTAEP